MPGVPQGLHSLRTPFVSCHLLVDDRQRAVFIDTGFIGTPRLIRRLFARLDLKPSCVGAILLTHGHLDHAGNLAWLKAWTGAPAYGHPAEQAHVDGAFPYRGIARVCGLMEAGGRRLTRYRPAAIDRSLRDGEELPFWDGLHVVHLPGHTLGHCGFWSQRHHLLFAADLVAIWTWRTTFPPPIYNAAPQMLMASLLKAASLRPRLVVPNHYNRFDPVWMADRFARFAATAQRERSAETRPAV